MIQNTNTYKELILSDTKSLISPNQDLKAALNDVTIPLVKRVAFCMHRMQSVYRFDQKTIGFWVTVLESTEETKIYYLGLIQLSLYEAIFACPGWNPILDPNFQENAYLFLSRSLLFDETFQILQHQFSAPLPRLSLCRFINPLALVEERHLSLNAKINRLFQTWYLETHRAFQSYFTDNTYIDFLAKKPVGNRLPAHPFFDNNDPADQYLNDKIRLIFALIPSERHLHHYSCFTTQELKTFIDKLNQNPSLTPKYRVDTVAFLMATISHNDPEKYSFLKTYLNLNFIIL